MPELEDIIKSAIDEATDTGNVPEPMEGEESEPSDEGDADTGGDETAEGDSDTSDESDQEDGVEEQISNEESEEPEPEPEPARKEPTAEDKEFEAVLKELGINKPNEKARRNRIPYDRTLRTLVNTVKKERTRLAEAHGKEIGPVRESLSKAEAALANFQNADVMMRNDPEMFIRTLAAMYPDKYTKYLGGAAQQKVDPNAEMPQPDVKYDDGTMAYSPEQYKKLMMWNQDQAVARAREESDRLYGPIVKRDQAQQLINQTRVDVQQRVTRQRDVWGAEFYNTNEVEIAKAVNEETQAARRENRQPIAFESLVAHILVPKMQEKVDKAREKAQDELKKAPKAAIKTHVASSRPVKPADDDRPLEDKMKDAVSNFKRLHGIR